MYGTFQRRTPWEIQKSVILALFIRELRVRFGHYKGGYIWMVLEPLAHVLILSSIITFIRHRVLAGVDIPVFVVTGVVPFLLFKNIAIQVMESAEASKALFTYRQVRPMDVFLGRTILNSVISLGVFAIMLTALAWLGMDVPFADPMMVLIVFALLILLGLGLGMILCVFVYLMPEVKNLMRLMFMPLYLISGIIYPITSINPTLLEYVMWNPVLHAVETLRVSFFVSYHSVTGISLTYVSVIALVLMLLGMAMYSKKRFELMAS